MIFVGDSDGEDPVVLSGCGDDEVVAVNGWKVVLFWLEASVVGWEEVVGSDGVMGFACEELFG